MDESTGAPKKTNRTKKTTPSQVVPNLTDTALSTAAPKAQVTQVFDGLMSKIIQSKEEFDNLQKEIERVKQDWIREQRQHELELSQQKTQEELERKRGQETYEYQTVLTRKRAEDEFEDKKLAWEKDLAHRKEELEVQRREFEELKKQAANFESEKEQAVKEAEGLVETKLTEKFENQRILREQEIKSEKEILGLKISNLESENSRFNKEIEALKRAFDESTKQVKEIAVKVIESGNSQNKPQVASQE